MDRRRTAGQPDTTACGRRIETLDLHTCAQTSVVVHLEDCVNQPPSANTRSAAFAPFGTRKPSP